MYRLRRCGDWLALLVGQALTMSAPKQSHGRLIRILDIGRKRGSALALRLIAIRRSEAAAAEARRKARRGRRARGLSPLGLRRLTRPGLWRLLRQLVRSLLQAIMPQPDLADLFTAKPMLRRHLHEPPRKKREHQRLPWNL
jgi:hypothetical protein